MNRNEEFPMDLPALDTDSLCFDELGQHPLGATRIDLPEQSELLSPHHNGRCTTAQREFLSCQFPEER